MKRLNTALTSPLHPIGEPILDDPLVGWNEVLEWTSIPRSTIYTMINQGRFPRPIPVSGKIVRWPKSDLIAWRDNLRDAQNTPKA